MGKIRIQNTTVCVVFPWQVHNNTNIWKEAFFFLLCLKNLFHATTVYSDNVLKLVIFLLINFQISLSTHTVIIASPLEWMITGLWQIASVLNYLGKGWGGGILRFGSFQCRHPSKHLLSPPGMITEVLSFFFFFFFYPETPIPFPQGAPDKEAVSVPPKSSWFNTDGLINR